MSDEKTVTEREAVERERAAFFAGTRWQFEDWSDERQRRAASGVLGQCVNAHDSDRARAKAKSLYSMPKITRPLHGTFSTGYEAYAVVGGLHWRQKAVGGFRYYDLEDSLNAFIETKEDVLLLARMLSGEVEVVDAVSPRGPDND